MTDEELLKYLFYEKKIIVSMNYIKIVKTHTLVSLKKSLKNGQINNKLYR